MLARCQQPHLSPFCPVWMTGTTRAPDVTCSVTKGHRWSTGHRRENSHTERAQPRWILAESTGVRVCPVLRCAEERLSEPLKGSPSMAGGCAVTQGSPRTAPSLEVPPAPPCPFQELLLQRAGLSPPHRPLACVSWVNSQPLRAPEECLKVLVLLTWWAPLGERGMDPCQGLCKGWQCFVEGWEELRAKPQPEQ